MISNKPTSSPLVEPVTLTEARGWLGATNTTQAITDDIIEGLIVSARQHAEAYTSRPFINRTYKMVYDFMNLCKIRLDGDGNAPVELGSFDLQSVESVKIYDKTNTATTLVENTDYIVDIGSNRIILQTGNVTLFSNARASQTLEVNYTAGFGTTPCSIPVDVKTAIQILISDQYNVQLSYRGAGAGLEGYTRNNNTAISEKAERLLQGYRVMARWVS